MFNGVWCGRHGLNDIGLGILKRGVIFKEMRMSKEVWENEVILNE